MTLHRTVRGDGPPVVLLHSGGMSSRQWRKLQDALATTHRVVAPDLLGSGDNPPWPEGVAFHYEQDAAEVRALLDELGAPAHLVGHSYGGLLACFLARTEPARVRSLAVYDPVTFGVLRGEPDADALMGAWGGARPRLLDDATGGGATWFEAFVDWWNGPGTWQALPEPTRAAFLRVGRKVYFEVKSLLADATPAAAYAAITAPTLLLTGEHTPPAERRVVEKLARTISGATARVIAGAGHMGPISHAAEVNAAIAAHVRR